jgi:hypothetical protein
MDQGSIGQASNDQPKLTEGDYLATKRQLDLALARIAELEAKLEEATVWAERAIEDVVDRDQRIRQHGQLERELQEQSQAANRALAGVYQTKIWRAATAYWRVRDRIRWLLGRRVSPN